MKLNSLITNAEMIKIIGSKTATKLSVFRLCTQLVEDLRLNFRFSAWRCSYNMVFTLSLSMESTFVIAKILSRTKYLAIRMSILSIITRNDFAMPT